VVRSRWYSRHDDCYNESIIVDDGHRGYSIAGERVVIGVVHVYLTAAGLSYLQYTHSPLQLNLISASFHYLMAQLLYKPVGQM
jgi:hypothetical protein